MAQRLHTSDAGLKIIAETLDASIEEVRQRLRDIGEPEHSASQISNRRYYIKHREQVIERSKHRDRNHGAKRGGTRKKRLKTPRPGSAGALACTFPLSMSQDEVYRRVVEAGFDVSLSAVATARLRYKHLLEEQESDLHTSEPQRAAVVHTAPKSIRALDPRVEMARLVMRVGLDVAESVIADLKAINRRFETGV